DGRLVPAPLREAGAQVCASRHLWLAPIVQAAGAEGRRGAVRPCRPRGAARERGRRTGETAPLINPRLDPRTHAYRAGLAAEALGVVVTAPRYVNGELRQVKQGAAGLWARPDRSRGWASQVLFGELVEAYEEKAGWAWVQALRDGYVGYLEADALSPD